MRAKYFEAAPFSADPGSAFAGDRLAALILSRTVAAAYSDVIHEPLPERLKQLAKALDARLREAAASPAREAIPHAEGDD